MEKVHLPTHIMTPMVEGIALDTNPNDPQSVINDNSATTEKFDNY